MQVFCRTGGLLVLSLGLCSAAMTQTTAKSPHKPSPWKKYCHGEDGFCFKYPNSWTMLGEIFAGNGVVVAPPQKQERALWDEVTIALVIPSPEGDEDPVTIDQAITQAVSSVRESGQSVETLQRQQRTVDDKPAQLVKLHYVAKPSGHEWIEELVFVEGPDAEIYSVALKCAPSSLVRLEPIFSRIVDSWTLPEVESAPGATDEESPQTKPPTAPASPPESVPPKASARPEP
jgi:hypothetical protein